MVSENCSREVLNICGGGIIISVNPEMCGHERPVGSPNERAPCTILGNLPITPFLRRTAMQKTVLARIASQEVMAWKPLIIDLSATKSANC
jgi:hypothetical protein